ncbi:hypothetical protein SUGI_1085300 [Cryptomeria japonica]|nr:hypothetical protein SUGI_1085300 [Cryptomeria japonica]
MEDIKMEQYMPSTSKIPFHSGKEYHVFLSFRGELRETLVHHLYEALTAAGLDVFVDSHKLEKGEIIESSLERALKGSAIRIPIFSQGYAQSAWCLREAATMVNTKGLIIPLFYDVLPTDVRFPLKESSPYKAAFLNHYAQSYHKGADIDGWKDALHQICSRSGWSMDLSGGSEAQLIKTVVNDVIKTFDRVHLQVAKHPVGLESLTHDLIHKFKLNSEGGVNKAGLWGIGGIGKTTLAKALYNQVSAKFDAASFVFNVRATAAEFMGLTKLQKKILKDLANHDEEVDSVEKGISLFRHRLRQKRVLLILDDVDGVEQLNALDGDWLAPGSGVIITSRDRHILRHAGVLSECIHEMSGLLINEGLQLFCWHAFLREHPTPTHKDLSERIVEACQGHPLSLEVIGSLLYDKQNDPDCWTEAFHNITLHPDIHERLKISYNALTEEEKEIFLDIACFFIGEHKMLPIVFWKSLYKTVHTAVHNLSLKLLIKIDDKGVFDMHDHLRDMGRSIAAERERECTRLWNADHLSRGVSNNNNFSRLRLNGGNSQRFETLYGSGLRLLHLENVPIAGITRAMLPPSLIWLQLQDCEKPSHFSLMRNMWRFAIQRPFHFRLMDLRILQTDGNISNLQYSLSYILGNLSQLQHLQLRNCRKLNKLPRTIGNLSKLQSLDLSYCIKLKKLSRTIGNLSQLQHLDLGIEEMRSRLEVGRLKLTTFMMTNGSEFSADECFKDENLALPITVLCMNYMHKLFGSDESVFPNSKIQCSLRRRYQLESRYRLESCSRIYGRYCNSSYNTMIEADTKWHQPCSQVLTLLDIANLVATQYIGKDETCMDENSRDYIDGLRCKPFHKIVSGVLETSWLRNQSLIHTTPNKIFEVLYRDLASIFFINI